jgi:hypothetical protein
MGIQTIPAPSAGGIKSVQRGSAAGAGTVTITAVDTAKAFVNIFGTASSGTVSASFNMNMNAGSVEFIGAAMTTGGNSRYIPANTTVLNSAFSANNEAGGAWTKNVTVNAGTASVGAGSNNLVAAVVQGYLSDATSLVVSGACRWEVVEFA